MKIAIDLKRKNRIYFILAFIFITLDGIANLALQVIDITFTIGAGDSDSDFYNKLISNVIEIVIVTGYIIFVLVTLYFNKRMSIAINSFAYLILGLLLFCYMLIIEIMVLSGQRGSFNARPLSFYLYHIDKVMLAVNISDFIFRLSGCIFLCLVSSTLRKIDTLIKNELDSKLDASLMNKNEAEGINHVNLSKEEGCKEYEVIEKRHSSLQINYIQPSSASSSVEKDIPNIKPLPEEEFNSSKYFRRILGKVSI